MVLAILAAVMAAAAVAAVVVVIAWPKENRLATRLRDYQDGPMGERPPSGGLLKRSSLPGAERAAAKLAMAGNPYNLSVETFLTIQWVATIGLPLILIGPTITSGALSIGGLVMGLGAGGFGYILPQFWLSSQVSRRKKSIEKQLPDAIDLVTVCVEAGQSVDAALQRVTEKWRGPLSMEIRQTLTEVEFGRPRREAFRDLGRRSDVQDLNSLTTSLVQAEQMGVSVGRVLRTQAKALRAKRRQRAQEMAQKAPIKMLIPLVLFIFPSMFVIILGPALIIAKKAFS